MSKLQVERQGIRIKVETSPVMRGTAKEPILRMVSPRVEEMFGFAETLVVDNDDLYAGKICAAMVYLISSNQPIAKLLAPNRIDIGHIYEEQFVGMTVEPVTLQMLTDTREVLIHQLHEKLTDRYKEFLLRFKRGEPDWSLLPFENIDHLPSVKWKILNLEKMEETRRNEAYEKLECILRR